MSLNSNVVANLASSWTFSEKLSELEKDTHGGSIDLVYHSLLPYYFEKKSVSGYLQPESVTQTNKSSLDDASRIFSLFDQDFLSICGEAFVITCAIGVLIYGVISSFDKATRVGELKRYSQEKALSSVLSSEISFEEKRFIPLLLGGPSKQSALFTEKTQSSSLQSKDSSKQHVGLVKNRYNDYTQSRTVHEMSRAGETFDGNEKAKRRINIESNDSSKYDRVNNPILVQNCGVHALLILFFALFLLVNNPLYGEAFYNSIVIDYFTRFMQIGICLATFFSVCISLQYLQKINTYELVVLILLAVGSMLLLASASDYICVYAAIEFQSLCFYVLAGLKRNSESSTEAGLKYLLLGAFSSGILLFGCSLLYTFTGTSSFFELAHLLSNSEFSNIHSNLSDTVLTKTDELESSIAGSYGFKQEDKIVTLLPLRACQLGFTFLLVGLLFKCAAAPFHMWVPDVYEGAPTPITLFFSIVPKLSVFAVLIRLLSCGTLEGCISVEELQAQTGDQIGSIQQVGPYSVLVFSCIASLLVGTFSAISQNKIKRLLAYSSIGHVGFLLIGCTLHSGEGIVALLVYLLIYIAMTIPIFAYMLSPLARERYIQLSGER